MPLDNNSALNKVTETRCVLMFQGGLCFFKILCRGKKDNRIIRNLCNTLNKLAQNDLILPKIFNHTDHMPIKTILLDI